MKTEKEKKKKKPKFKISKNKCSHKEIGNSWGWYVCKSCGIIW